MKIVALYGYRTAGSIFCGFLWTLLGLNYRGLINPKYKGETITTEVYAKVSRFTGEINTSNNSSQVFYQ
jgi:hypothetical protein